MSVDIYIYICLWMTIYIYIYMYIYVLVHIYKYHKAYIFCMYDSYTIHKMKYSLRSYLSVRGSACLTKLVLSFILSRYRSIYLSMPA